MRYIVKRELEKIEPRVNEIQDAALLHLIKSGLIPKEVLPPDALETLEYRAKLLENS